jgi:hypothetical protein
MPVFTHSHARVVVTPEQDETLREYATRFGRVERTLFADLAKGVDVDQLRSNYPVRIGITTHQFEAVRAQLHGKIEAARKELLSEIDRLKTEIGGAETIVSQLNERLPRSNQLHQEKRRLRTLKQRLEKLEVDRDFGRIRLCFGSRELFHLSFI